MQVEAGAEVILTQPPLLKRQFEAWYEGLIRQVYCLLHPVNCLVFSVKTERLLSAVQKCLPFQEISGS